MEVCSETTGAWWWFPTLLASLGGGVGFSIALVLLWSGSFASSPPEPAAEPAPPRWRRGLKGAALAGYAGVVALSAYRD